MKYAPYIVLSWGKLVRFASSEPPSAAFLSWVAPSRKILPSLFSSLSHNSLTPNGACGCSCLQPRQVPPGAPRRTVGLNGQH